MTKEQKAQAIAAELGIVFSRSDEDYSFVAGAPKASAEELRSRLTDAGIEASCAPDNEDKAISWVYATVDEVAS